MLKSMEDLSKGVVFPLIFESSKSIPWEQSGRLQTYFLHLSKKSTRKLALPSPFRNVILQEDLISHNVVAVFKFFNMIANLRLHLS